MDLVSDLSERECDHDLEPTEPPCWSRGGLRDRDLLYSDEWVEKASSSAKAFTKGISDLGPANSEEGTAFGSNRSDGECDLDLEPREPPSMSREPLRGRELLY